MPGRSRSKFTAAINGQIKTALFDVLTQASDYDNPTIEWIKSHSIYLSNFTQQKLSRSLNELLEMGVIGKTKLKNGRMVYRLKTEYPKTSEYFGRYDEEGESDENEEEEEYD